MSLTYLEFISLSCQQALAGLKPLTAPVLDIEMTAETLVPSIFQQVALSAAADEQKRSLLNRTYSITLTNGTGNISELALTSCKFVATVSDPNDSTVGPLMSMVLNWNDFISPLDTRLGYWIIKGDRSLHWIEPGDTYDPSSGKTGSVQLTIPSVPAIPATSSATLVADDEIISDLIDALALALRGKMSNGSPRN